jgi:Ran GTPase-activating protein (RanGAP) involved in mRNA processing and transport
LNLGFNRLRSNGVEIVFESLVNNSKLKSLDLSGNEAKSQGLKGLLVGISNRSDGLEVLGIGQNDIKDEGMKYLSYSLMNNSCLQKIYINLYNGITDVGMNYFTKVLERSETGLKFVDLSGNLITDTGAKQIIDDLDFRKYNLYSSIDVHLKGNKIVSPDLSLKKTIKSGATVPTTQKPRYNNFNSEL